jgi:hypothetical protein
MRRFLTGPAAILTVVCLIAGCSSSDDTADETTTAAPATTVAPAATVIADATTTTDVTTTTEATTTAAPQVTADTLLLTFDGDSCTYEGPTVLTAGPVELVFLNKGEGPAAVNMVSIDEGYTIQDVIDDLGPEPSTSVQPSWRRALVPDRGTAPGESHRWEGDLEAGLYAMVCLVPTSPLSVWFGTGLTVEQ